MNPGMRKRKLMQALNVQRGILQTDSMYNSPRCLQYTESHEVAYKTVTEKSKRLLSR